MIEYCTHAKIVLFPDFSSTGVWCETCGIGFAIPKESFANVPGDLFDLIEGWNNLWDFACVNYDRINVYYFENQIANMGRILAEMVNKYYPCAFDKERSKLFNGLGYASNMS